jgi:hypothetical protein
MTFCTGEPSEAANVLIIAIGSFSRVPGAKDLLSKRFGTCPVYDTDCSNPLYPFGF